MSIILSTAINYYIAVKLAFASLIKRESIKYELQIFVPQTDASIGDGQIIFQRYKLMLNAVHFSME